MHSAPFGHGCSVDHRERGFDETNMPTSIPPTGSARISMRSSPDAKALIERAAAITGRTVSSFILQHGHEAAQRIVSDNDRLLQSRQLSEALFSAIDNPQKPSDTRRKAFPA